MNAKDLFKQYTTAVNEQFQTGIATEHSYRPLSDTSSFNDYTKDSFNDDAQIRLKEYYDCIHEAGFRFVLSNSDCKGKNKADNFFDVLYEAYDRTRIYEQNGTPNIVCRNYKKD